MSVDLLSELREAIPRGEIFAEFQPQIDVATRDVVAVEALARWKHPELGMIPPWVFIPIAEHSGLISDIGGVMIDEGCRCAASWSSRGFDLEVAVNVSAAQLENLVLDDQISSALETHSLSAGRLVIEVTESMPVITAPGVDALLHRIRERGVLVSVDDFGTGHSSLEQLMQLPASEVKIDKSRVTPAGPGDPFIVDVVRLARERGLRVVAEGIETEEQLVLMRDLGVDRAQGFLLGRPQSEQDLTRLLQLSA